MNVAQTMKQFKTAISKELPFLFSLPALLWQIFFLFIPLLVIIYFSFFYMGPSGRLQITLENYTALFNPVYMRIIGRSLALAFGSTVVSFLCAYPVAYFLALRIRRFKGLLLFLLTLPFWTTFLVQIYAWFFLLERNGIVNTILLKLGIISQPLAIINSLWAVFIVMIYCYLPFMIMPLYTVLAKIDSRLLEASADLGATPWQTFIHVTLPLSLPGIQTGVLLVLIPVFGEFAIPTLLGGSQYMMVGSLISYYFLMARSAALGASFTVISSIILFLFVGAFYWVCKFAHAKTRG